MSGNGVAKLGHLMSLMKNLTIHHRLIRFTPEMLLPKCDCHSRKFFVRRGIKTNYQGDC